MKGPTIRFKRKGRIRFTFISGDKAAVLASITRSNISHSLQQITQNLSTIKKNNETLLHLSFQSLYLQHNCDYGMRFCFNNFWRVGFLIWFVVLYPNTNGCVGQENIRPIDSS